MSMRIGKKCHRRRKKMKWFKTETRFINAQNVSIIRIRQTTGSAATPDTIIQIIGTNGEIFEKKLKICTRKTLMREIDFFLKSPNDRIFELC